MITLMKLRNLLLAIWVLAFAKTGHAQAITNYTFAASSGTFTALSGANSLALNGGNADDGYFNGIPIGFDFWYMGTRYTTVSASTNGWITLGANITNSTYTNGLAYGGAPRPVIAPLWDDIDIQVASNVTYLTSGSAGSRIFTLQYLNTQWQYVATGNTMSFQVKLYESTGKIEFVYRQETGALSSPSASIGICATSTGNGNYLSLSDAGVSPAASSTVATNGINTKPATGQKYVFTPAVPTAPSNLAFSSVGATSMTLSWNDNSANEAGFVIYRSTNGVNYTFLDQGSANVTTYVASGLTPSTTYYWRIYAVTEGGLSTALSGSQATVCVAPNISQIPTTNLIGNYRFEGNATDVSGTNHGTLQGSPTSTTDRFDISGKAYAFNGSSQYVSTTHSYANPNNFTISIWFKTTTTTGGKLIGFGVNQTGSSYQYDRHLYMNNAGQIYFGVYPNTVRTVQSSASYNDGNWHMATATLSSSNGMVLYMDGAQVGADPTTTSAENYTGYWRIGYDNNNGWTSQPSSFYFSGTLDDALVYSRALTPSEVNTLYTSPDGAGNNGPLCEGVTLNLTATTVGGATYAWSGPNSFSSSSQNPSLTYSAPYAGVYTLQATLSGCTATAYTRVTSSTVAGQWTGNTSTDWATASNWCTGVVPTSSTDVTIPAGVSNMPSVSSSAACRNLTINAGATLTTTSGGTLNIAGSLANAGTMTNSGTTNFNGTTGQQTFSGVTAFYNLTVSNASGLLLPSAITVGNNLTLSAGTLNANNFNISVAGSWLNNASTSAFAGSTATVTFNGTAAQTLGGTYATTFNNLTVSNVGNTVTSAVNCTVGGNLTVASGTLNLGTFSANRGSTGGVLTVANNATLKIGGTNSFPTNYATNNLVLASNVEYAGTNQTVANHTYGNLILSSASGAAVKTFPGTAMTVAGNLSSTLGSGTSVTFTAASDLTVNGNVTIGASTTFNGGSATHHIGGNWVGNGTFTGNASTIRMEGPNTSISGTGTHNFHNLTVAASQVTISASSSLAVAGNLATVTPGSVTHAAGGTLTMAGASKTISGTGIILDNLTVTGSVTTATSATLTGNLSVSGSLTATGGTVTMSGASKTISGAGTIALNSLLASGSISTAANFSIASALSVSGSLTATAGTATFTSTSSLSGTANLYNVTVNGTSLQLSTNAVLGIANALSIAAGTLDVSTTAPNTVAFNGTGAQTVNGITYSALTLTNGNTKTASGAIVVNHDLLIDASTTLDAATYAHAVKRNWTNNGTFTAGSSTVSFTGIEDATLTGATTFNVLTVDKSSTTNLVTLASNVTAPTLNMTNGALHTGSNTITITTTRTGNGEITGNIQRTHSFTTGTAYAFGSPDNSITFASVSGVSSITVSIVKAPIADFPFGGSISRVYDITVPAGTYTATLRLYYHDHELNGNDESSMELWHYNGSAWTAVGKTGNSAVANYVEQSGLTDITNRWTCSDDANVVQWNGSVSGDWNTAANWSVVQGSASTPPAASDIAKLGTIAFTNQPVISNAVTVKNISFGSAQAVTLTLASGGSLTSSDIKGTWTANAAHTLDVGNQSLTVNGDLMLSDGTSGHTIDLNIGTGTVSVTGSLTESGGANVTFSGAGTLNIGAHFHYSSGTFTPGSGTVVYNGTGNQNVGIVDYYHLTSSNATGIVTINGNVDINGNLLVAAGDLDNLSTISIGGNVTINSGAVLENWQALQVGGNWVNNGSFNDYGGTTTFNGSGAQSISTSAFGNLDINKPSGTATLLGDLTIGGDINVLSGTLDLQSYLCTRTVLGGQATLSNGATAILGGNNPPVNFAMYSIGATSTVIFDGAVTQNLDLNGLDFGNVTFRNSGTKVFVSPASILGNLTIESGATVDAAAYPITLAGNWTNDGTFIPSTSKMILTGVSKTLSGATTFNQVIASGSYTVTSDVVFNDSLRITSTGALSAGSGRVFTLNGNLINSGTVNILGTIVISGNTAQTLSLINATTYVGTVTFNGTVSPTLNSTSTPTFGFVNINNTGGVNPSVGWTVAYGMTVGAGASFNGGGSTHTLLGALTNNGTITSSGTMNFVPSAAATVNLGSAFSSTGTVVFGGAGAMTLMGTPTSMRDVIVSNTNVAGVTPSSDWLITNDLSINSGATLNAGARTYTVGGDFRKHGTWNSGTSTVVLNGTGTQEIASTPVSSGVTFHHLTVNKTADVVSLSTDATVTGTLNFTDGNIETGSYTVILPASGALSGAAQNTGWVNGNLRKNIGTGTPSAAFEVGGASYYTPATLTFASVTTGGDLTVGTTASDHPGIGGTNLNPTKSLNRYWSLTNSGIAFTTYDATFNYVAGDVDGGATPTLFEIAHFNGSSWEYPTIASAAATHIQATGIGTFGDVAAGEICNKGTVISYTGSPYCSDAGTATVTQQGTAGGTYSSTAGLSIHSTTGDITLASSTAGTYNVIYTVAAAGGCPVYTTTTNVVITAPPAAVVSYPSTPYCVDGGEASPIVTGTAGGTFSSTAGLSINPSTGAVDLAGSTPGTYTVKYVMAGTGGCSADSTTTSIEVSGLPNMVPYANLIAEYKFEETALDATGNNDGTLQNDPSPTTDRFSSPYHAYSFDGSAAYISTTDAYSNPNDFTVSVWFSTTSTSGGRLVGLGSSQTGASGNADRHIYMNNAGHIYFGVNPGPATTIHSPAAYNDGYWHMATATLSSTDGMVLYIDGAQVAANPSITSGANYAGYWRIGYDDLGGWTSQPSSNHYGGKLDDVTLYDRAITADEVGQLYNALEGAGNNGPVCTGSTLDLTANTVSGATYSWTGPNGFSSSAQNPSLAFTPTEAGVYTVQVFSGGCLSTAYTHVAATSVAGMWTGNVNSDWATAANWCDGNVPTSATDVTIPDHASTMPTIGSSVTCRDLTIQTGATLTTNAGGTLSIAGALVNDGTMTNGGTTRFSGTSGQQTFAGVTAFTHLVLDNADGLLLPASITASGNLTITTGTLDVNNFDITLGGDWSNSGTLAAGTGEIILNSTAMQSISQAGMGNFYDLTINKSSNAAALGTDITVTHTLTLSAGPLDLNTHTLHLDRSDTAAIVRAAGYVLSEQTDNSSAIAWLIGANPGRYRFPFGAVTGNYIPVVAELGDGDIGIVTISTYPTAPNNAPYPVTPTLVTNLYDNQGQDNSANAVDRFWEVNTTGPTGYVNLTFNAQLSEVGSVANLVAQRWDSLTNTWDEPLPGQSRSSTSVTVPNVNEFTTWALTGENSPFPVEFLSFDAYPRETDVAIKWVTVTETNSDHFTVQRSRDGIRFENLEIVPAAGTSRAPLHYSTVDPTPYEGRSYYRIVETDIDGSTTQTEAVEVNFDPWAKVLMTAYPNPTTQDNLRLQITGAGGETMTLYLTDLMGKEYCKEQVTVEGDPFVYTFHPHLRLASGIYLLGATSNHAKYSAKVFVK